MSVLLQVDKLQQAYGRHEVLHDFQLQLAAGETLALLGRNGAGKTTLIRTLMGLLRPVAGTVQVLGMDPAQHPLAVRRRVGYLGEDQAIYDWMTPLEVGRFLAPFYPTWDPALYTKLLSQFELAPDRKIKQLSKGQSVRLGLALAIAHRPELMILDDPALGLDPIARKEFNRDLVEFLQAEGQAVLYSSHLLSEVEAVADRVAILDNGRLLRSGETEEVQHQVKRVIVAVADVLLMPAPHQLLDVRRDGEHLLITLDHAPLWLDTLRAASIDYRVEDLSLDEIFEAYVIGRPGSWPGGSPKPVAAAA